MRFVLSITYYSLLYAVTAATLLTGGCGVKSGSSVPNRVGSLEAPSNVDLGYVPPQGATYKVTVRNATQNAVAIASISSSCGCTAVTWPKQIKAHSTGEIELNVSGLQRLARRDVRLVLSTTLHDEKRIDLTYTTGALPQLDTSEFLRTASDSQPYNCNLHVITDQPNQVIKCIIPGSSPYDVMFDESLPNGFMLSPDRKCATVVAPGVHILPVNINCQGAAAPNRVPITSCRLAIKVGDTEHFQPLRFIDDAPRPPAVHPNRAVIVYQSREELLSKSRNFYITDTAGLTCTLAAVPEGLSASLTPMTESAWVLKVSPKTTDLITDGRHSVVVACGDSRMTAVVDITTQ